MKHFHTFTKRAILGLTALTVALALLVSAACSGNEMNPTPPTDRGDQTLVEEINRLKSETASLRQEVEELRSAEGQEPAHSTVQAEPESTRTTKTPESQETTKPARPAETPEGTLTGICYRTPELQEVLLEMLDVELCQVINEKELYRIRDLKAKMPSVKEGDFEGLVNVESLSVTTGPIGINGLRGLESLRELSLSVQKTDGLATESFSGLESIEELTIRVNSAGHEHTGLQLPGLPNLPNLKRLKVYKMRPQSHDEESISPFRNLDNLESIDLTLVFGNTEDDAREEPYHIPANLLEGNRRLKEIRIETWVMPSGHEIQLPEGMFKANPALERVEISYPRTFIEKKTFIHLDNLKELSLLNSSSWTPVKLPTLVISEKSPLYKAIKSGETKPSRYLLVEPTDQ